MKRKKFKIKDLSTKIESVSELLNMAEQFGGLMMFGDAQGQPWTLRKGAEGKMKNNKRMRPDNPWEISFQDDQIIVSVVERQGDKYIVLATKSFKNEPLQALRDELEKDPEVESQEIMKETI